MNLTNPAASSVQVPNVTFGAKDVGVARGHWVTVRRESSGCGSGSCPDVLGAVAGQARRMSRYLLQHRHSPDECGVVFASFRGHKSPLRHQMTLASCRSGGHAIWWTVDAASEKDALELLPFYVAKRTTIARVSEVQIP
jgi:hypothetical protein